MRRYKIEFGTDDKENPICLDGYIILKLNEKEIDTFVTIAEENLPYEWNYLQGQEFEEIDGKQYVWFTTEYKRGEIGYLKEIFKESARNIVKEFTDLQKL